LTRPQGWDEQEGPAVFGPLAPTRIAKRLRALKSLSPKRRPVPDYESKQSTRSTRDTASLSRTHTSDALGTLGWGERWDFYPFRCWSRRSGMTCTNRVAGHGFFLSRGTANVW
jgi:hypothetical protein